ncbi:MAG TPA: glycosyltransferase [Tepidisphaeraceae bacterium]|jgi:glycogen(starch) synthase|nr:glycosyltransferase [Tepidisphaeraceae bacterium]
MARRKNGNAAVKSSGGRGVKPPHPGSTRAATNNGASALHQTPPAQRPETAAPEVQPPAQPAPVAAAQTPSPESVNEHRAVTEPSSIPTPNPAVVDVVPPIESTADAALAGGASAGQLSPGVEEMVVPQDEGIEVSFAVIPEAAPPAPPAPGDTAINLPESEEAATAFDEPTEPAAVEPPAPVQLPPLLFEVAWEVCWQLGGIYTVLRSKAVAMQKRWGDRYCLIGPYNPQTAAFEFEETPIDAHLQPAIQALRDSGIPCHYGRWLIAGRPRVLLIDYRARYASLDIDKFVMWNDHGIGTLAADGEVNEVIAFGFATTEFFRHLSAAGLNRPILAHFHEWMGGVAVPRIAHLQLPVATVFTTHATLLGRYLASDNPEFYNNLPYINPEAEAQRYGIYPRYQIEKAAAHASTVFTTVSEVTDVEAEKLLGRKADAILPNGLNIQRFAAPHEFQHLHRQNKEKIHEFVMGHFFPSAPFDLDRTIYLFTSGRYEYRNKGFDLFLESLYRLNQRLREMPDRPTVVAFIVTKAQVRNINVGVLQNQSMFDDLKNWCAELERRMGHRLFMNAATGRIPKYEDLLNDDSIVRLKQSIAAWRSGRLPPVVTHDLVDDVNDPTLKHIRHRGLFNAPDDPVKIVFHPQFVTATSPLLNLDYENFVRGCHMGVFPSYYEPWGYTPMECIALGLPAVTSDLSGFGAYTQRHLEKGNSRVGDKGICVLNRRTKSFEETTANLADHLFNFCQLNRRQRIELRNATERLGELFDWSALVSHYHDAHEMALQRKGVEKPTGAIEVRFA